jgi:dihydrofolate reductase
MTVTLVAAVARNGVIGHDGGIPWRLPGEQAHFKTVTMGHVLVMGRRTYESIGRPLPGRTTVVVTRNPDWRPPGDPTDVLTAPTVEAALQLGATLDEQVYVVGGEQVYSESLATADELLITEVDAEPRGDTFFPEVEWSQWVERERHAHNGWTVTRYRRRSDGKGYGDGDGDAG